MPTIIRVTPSQAAQLFGVNERSIRRAINKGELRYIVVQGRYKINFEDLIKWSQHMPSREKKRDEDGIGQYVEKWKIRNPKYSPSKKLVSNNNNGDDGGEEKEER